MYPPLRAAGANSNTATQLYSCNGGSSEYWQFAVQPSVVAGQLSTTFPYAIVSQASGNCLTGTAGGGQNTISACTGASAQQWWLMPVSFAGYYMVVNSATGAQPFAPPPRLPAPTSTAPPGRELPGQ